VRASATSSDREQAWHLPVPATGSHRPARVGATVPVPHRRDTRTRPGGHLREISTRPACKACNDAIVPLPSEVVMQVFKDIFASDVGLLSAATLAVLLGMAVFFVRFFLKKIREDEAKAGVTR
jgi:hypothetical protein